MAGAKTIKVGPGQLIFGETGSTVEVDCQVTQAIIEWDVDTEDDVPLLCGDVEAGDEEFTATLSATLYQDLGAEDSFLEWTWANKGAAMPVLYIPSTAAGKQIEGIVKIRPMSVGGEAKTKPTSDIEFPFVGEPELEDVPVGG